MGRLTALLLIFLTLFRPSSAAASDLSVNVTGIKSDLGDVHVALFKRPEDFPEYEGIFREKQVLIRLHQAKAVFRGLQPGLYAIAIYHDENNNDEFDQGFLGIPLEDYGFSNGAKVFFGPPSFIEAAIDVPEAGLVTGIDLGNR